MNSSDLQIWNNAAFDDGDSEGTTIIKPSWSPAKPILVNRSDSLNPISSKENQSPVPEKPPLVSVKTPVPVKPLNTNGIIGNSQMKPTKLIPKQSLVEKEEISNEKKIDEEIEEIQFEISQLTSRLEALWLEKADQRLKLVEKQRRVVPAKFMDQKHRVKNTEGVKKIEEPSSISKLQRRGLSLGPSELAAGVRRGISLGPAEIYAGVKSKQLGKQEIITPVQLIKDRRKSCFWKLENIDELKITKERGKSSSISPKSRKTISKTQPLRQAVTTVGSKKCVKKEDGVFSTIQPKKLFKDGEKSVPANTKQSLKPRRVIASRYNQSSSVQSIGNSSIRKRFLPENEQEESKRFGFVS